MKIQFLSLLLLVLNVSQVFAFIKPRISFSSGSNGYESMSASVRIGKKLYVQPGYRSYSNNSVPGEFETFSGRIGYDADHWGLSFEGGATPENNDYKNAFAGADTWFEIPLLGGSASNPEDQILLEIGAGVLGTRHTDQLVALGGGVDSASLEDDSGGNGGHQSLTSLRRGEDDEPTVRGASALNIVQTDLSTSLGLSFFSLFAVDGEYSQSVYDKDLVAISARDLQLDGFEGVNSPVRGYRKSALTTRVSLLFLPIVTPFVSHSRISFELDDPTATSMTVGGSVALNPFRFDVAYETYDTGSASGKIHTTTFGSSVRF